MDKEESARKGHPIVTAIPHLFLTFFFFAYLFVSPSQVATTRTLWVSTIYGLVCGYITVCYLMFFACVFFKKSFSHTFFVCLDSYMPCTCHWCSVTTILYDLVPIPIDAS